MAGNKVALVFGASGVTGWAFVNEMLNDYPKKGIWSHVQALTNRPLSVEESMWPRDSRLTITSGINLLEESQEELNSKLGAIKDIGAVTHVFYLGNALFNNPRACN